LRPSAPCSRWQPRPNAQTHSRSAILALRRPFRKIPDWRRRKCTGDITAIIIIATIIIVGTAGIIVIITTTIITVTGIAGERDSQEGERVRFTAGPFLSSAPPRIRRDCCAHLNDLEQESVMRSWIAAAIVAAALLAFGPVLVDPAAAAPKRQIDGASHATDFSAHRHHRRYHRHHGRSNYQPYYYGRPVYYRPYPYQTPAPFTFGIGFGPSWW
jgi:hypothetical protein